MEVRSSCAKQADSRSRTLAERVANSRAICVEALREPSISAVGELLRAVNRGLLPHDPGLIDQTIALGKPSAGLAVWAARVDAAGIPQERRPLERLLLICAGLALLDRIEFLPVEESVRHLMCKEIALMAAPRDESLRHFAISSPYFIVLCKIARGVRFPAGQHQFECSAFPGSWLAKTPLNDVPKTLKFLLGAAHGVYPYFETHLAPPMHGVPVLLEREFQIAFYRMARTLELQPRIKALMAVGWMHCGETYRVSPHLAFMNRPFEQAGGLITNVGPASVNDGFLKGSPRRAELYSRGQYKPLRGLALCSRNQAIAWAASRQKLAELALRLA
jgi:hypothetical protein